jgi:hypothetical protein
MAEKKSVPVKKTARTKTQQHNNIKRIVSSNLPESFLTACKMCYCRINGLRMEDVTWEVGVHD